MLLKNSGATLLLVGLLACTNAFRLNTPADSDPSIVTGFKFVPEYTFGISVNATSGQIRNYTTMWNTTEWRPIFGSQFTAIQQTLQFLFLNIKYNTKSEVGPFQDSGITTANLVGKFNITMNATKTGGDCRLRVHLVDDNTTLAMNLTNLDVAGKVFGAVPMLISGLADIVLRALKNVLPENLTKLVLPVIEGRVNLKNLCEEVYNSTPENFAQPDINGVDVQREKKSYVH